MLALKVRVQQTVKRKTEQNPTIIESDGEVAENKRVGAGRGGVFSSNCHFRKVRRGIGKKYRNTRIVDDREVVMKG